MALGGKDQKGRGSQVRWRNGVPDVRERAEPEDIRESDDSERPSRLSSSGLQITVSNQESIVNK